MYYSLYILSFHADLILKHTQGYFQEEIKSSYFPFFSLFNKDGRPSFF